MKTSRTTSIRDSDTQSPVNCPATGRSAGACTDQTHVECWIGQTESVELDRKVARQLGT